MGTTPSTTPAKRSPPQCRKPKTSKSRKTKTDASIFSPVAVPSHSAAMACHVKIPTQLPLLIVDNGGWTVKYGILRLPPRPPISSSASTEPEEVTAKNIPPNEKNEGILISPRENDKIIQNITMASMYNATAQPPQQLTILTGDEITTRMKNLGQLSWNHSMERGIICDGGTQLRVWNRVLEVSNVAVPIPGLGLRNLPASRGRRGIEQQHIQMQMPLGGVPAVASSSGGTPLLNQTKISSGNCAFLLLEPPFVPSVISDGVDKILFRELGLGRVARLLGPCMAAVKYISSHNSILEQGDQNDPAQMTHDTINKRGRYEIVPDNASSSLQNSIHMNGDEKENRLDEVWINDGTKCCCVVDSGYSFTHVVPTHRGGAIESSIRRLNIGGKVLTNLLKEAVTYRQWNMMDEYHIVNDCKEQLCFVSNQFETEMKQARKIRKGFREFDREFLLPDFVNTFHGTVRLPEPLQWKKDAEEEKQIRMEIEVQQKKSGGEGQIRTNKTVENIDKNDDTYRKGNENSKESKITTKSKQSKSNKNEFLKLPRKRPKRGKIADANTVNNEAGDCDNETTEDSESDDESDEQRLHRLKQMREEERKRREQESLERQAIAMSVERFAIPEVLFRPSDIGMDCGGIVEAIVESIDACDAVYRAAMYNNVLLVGGNAKIPGFRDRVELELRKLAPVHYPVRVYLPDDPVSYSWEGAKQFAMQPDFQEKFTVDRISWEAMKTAGKDQKEIWGGRSCSRLRHVSMRS